MKRLAGVSELSTHSKSLLRSMELGACLFAALGTISTAYAHTVTVGYESGATAGDVNFWYGTYHSPSQATYTEGSMQLVGNSLNTTVSFTLLTGTKPVGLIDGTTNFYTDGISLVGTDINGNGDPQTWQGVSFSGLTAGTYVFTYIPISSPTAVWNPWDSIILSSSVTLSAQIISGGATDIDTALGAYLLSDLGDAVNPAFTGGTLQVDAPTTVSQDITISGAGGSIDQFGNSATFSGVFSDASNGVPGSLSIVNSGAAGGGVTLSGVSTFTGGTTIASGSTLALTGAGSI